METLEISRINVKETKEGQFVVADSSHVCIAADTILRVFVDGDGDLFVVCDYGPHYLKDNKQGNSYYGFRPYKPS